MNSLKQKYRALMEQSYWLPAIIKEPRTAKWYFHWRSSLDGQRSPLGDELPWITYGAIDWLASHLTKEMTLCEWGSGGSTLFFARSVKQVITIEHDCLWYQQMVQVLAEKQCANVQLQLAEPVQCEWVDPWYRSTDPRYADYSFEPYIKMIDTYSDGFFDVVVVDGRARPGCMKHALAKVKPGGFLVLDNSDRTEYQKGMGLIPQWRTIPKFGPGPYVNFPTGTTIWQRPWISE